jgi:endonuclease YncB( thermonuclease family)
MRMFGWRKRTDGFEWHKHIRTTILLKRAQRRERVENAKRAAALQVHAAGAALAAGSRVAGAASLYSARMGLSAAHSALGRLIPAAATMFARIGEGIGMALRPVVEVFKRPTVAAPLALAGIIALGGAAMRWRSGGLDKETGIALATACTLLCGTVPSLAARLGIASLQVGRLASPVATGAIAVVALGCGLAWIAGRNNITFAKFADFFMLTVPGGAKIVEGRASVVTGDMLRVGGVLVRLKGIEAPETEQYCTIPGKQRAVKCAADALGALQRLAGGRSVRCEIAGSDSSARVLGICFAGTSEINAELVKGGHVFAEQGVFAPYAMLEDQARTHKTGLWRGSPKRPSEYRTELWNQAKKAAPEGCPIKGAVSPGGKFYLLPWSPDYGRVRVRRAKGERWFCSEEEAQSAGWKAAARS